MELNETITERRRQTRNNIYQYLYHHKGFCSKQTISQDLGLSLPTVYQNLTELMDAGLVGFSGKQRSTGGRRAMGLDIVPNARITISISVSNTHVRLAAVDLRLQELCYRSIKRQLDENFDELVSFLAVELEAFLNENHIDRSKLLGVGIAFPGVISADRETMVLAPTLHLQNVRLRNLQDAIPYPVQIQNDGTCGGYAEWFVRAENGSAGYSGNMAYLFLETGVGGSLFLDGQLYDGDHARSGEFGHMCVETGGRLCECGKRGCLEAYCSVRRISDDLGLTLEEFFRELQAGNEEYAALWQDMLRHLAVAINFVNMMMDCEVVLGGCLSEYLEPWLPLLRQYVADGNPFESNGSFVHLSSLKSHNVSFGAALYYIKQFIGTI